MGCLHRRLLPHRPPRTLPPTSGQSHHPLLPRNNVGLSAVCAYNLSTAEAVFSRGKYMQSTTVEQSHTKWVRYNGAVPTPRPGAVSGRGLPPGSGGAGGTLSASWVLSHQRAVSQPLLSTARTRRCSGWHRMFCGINIAQ